MSRDWVWEAKNGSLRLHCCLGLIINVIVDAIVRCLYSGSISNWVIGSTHFSSVIPVDHKNGIEGSYTLLEYLGLINVEVTLFMNQFGLVAARVLVNSDDILVSQNCERLFGNSGQITSYDKRSLGECPKREMGSLLSLSKEAISYLEHIWVIPVTRSSN